MKDSVKTSLETVLYILAVIAVLAVLILGTAFILIPKTGLVPGIIVALTMLPFVGAVFAAKKPEK
jgi:hypothetical protein